MEQSECAWPDGVEAVAIVTPNHMHAPTIRAFLDAGIHVICDKPLSNLLRWPKAEHSDVVCLQDLNADQRAVPLAASRPLAVAPCGKVSGAGMV